MELQELKNVWNEYDRRIDDRIKIDYQFIKKISVEKTRSLLIPAMAGFVIEVVLNFIFLIPTLRFAANHINFLQFSLPAILLALMIGATITWAMYSIVLLATINYRAPVISIQKKLQTFKIQNLFRQQNLLYIIYPLSQTCVIIIFCKAVLDINVYNYLTFLLLQFISGVLIIPAIIWIVKKSPDKNMDAALQFLNDIKKFEKE